MSENITFSDIWENLSALDVSKKVRQRTGFNYLSWSWAYGFLIGEYPDARITPIMFEHADGTQTLHHPCPIGYMVMVEVSIEGHSRIEMLPVLDHKNKAIPEPTAFDINTSIQRCKVKCMAQFGLGLNIYADEDLPMAYQEYTPEEYEKFISMVDEQNESPITFTAWKQYTPLDKYNAVVNTWMKPFAKNKEKGKAGEWLTELDKRGHAQADDYFERFVSCIENESIAEARELRDELSSDEFALVWHRLEIEQRNAVRALLSQTTEYSEAEE